ncbi:Putative 5-oxoprolinase OplA (5-oxo-l-prolinase) (pyroglutamase) (5-opase) [Mycobacterium tuberculosis]|nr:Putative 5-oxoprolinase OplA (5-oxo-l-prolinase) (pyroglutamase) (5-opase) [Mycobacterium tuberculosis]
MLTVDDARPTAEAIAVADGSTVELAGCGSTHVEPGDTLVIETPGGGGYGPASTSARRRR